MENDREVDQVLMNIRNSSGGIISASLMSARISFAVLVYLMRLAKKGLVAAGFADNFKAFTKNTEGNYTVYNIPVAADRAESVIRLNELELKLQNAKKPTEKLTISNEIKKLKKELPELQQMKKLGINYCMLPKLNGSSQTLQVAVAKDNDQLFKNWFLNHLTTNLSGGEKGMEDLKVFTEGNFSIFNLPFEGETFDTALKDFDTLGMNYSILPDLNIGDGNSQIVIPNADRSKLEVWFKMYKDKQLREGKDPGEMYEMNQESYMDTSKMEAEDYIKDSDEAYQEANEEFEKDAERVPWSASLGKENSEEYERFLKDKNYEKITINEETLVKNMNVSTRTDEMRKNGYFISRVPGTYGDKQQTLILPVSQVFRTDEEKTYLAFIPKNKSIMVADASGNIVEKDFADVYEKYDRVKQNRKKVESLKKGMKASKGVKVDKTPKPEAPKL